MIEAMANNSSAVAAPASAALTPRWQKTLNLCGFHLKRPAQRRPMKSSVKIAAIGSQVAILTNSHAKNPAASPSAHIEINSAE
jgi:hypothetical protein